MLALFLITSLVISNVGDACITSSDEYAVETVIGDYSLFEIRKFSQIADASYVFPSQFNDKIYVIAKETRNPEGLSLRLQAPTELEETSKPYFKISAISGSGLKTGLQSAFYGWKIVCSPERCSFSKQDLSIEASASGQGTAVELEVTKNLEQCSEGCTGSCLELNTNSLCVDLATRSDIERVLRYANISTTFEELFKDYRVLGSEGLVINNIVPSGNVNIDWREAMRQELVFLKSREAIEISNSDIEEIASLSKRGQAGERYRIAYNGETGDWAYFNGINSAPSSTLRECKTYSIVEADEVKNQVRKIYYLVPVILVGTAVLLMIILIFVARAVRAINRRHEHDKKRAHKLPKKHK